MEVPSSFALVGECDFLAAAKDGDGKEELPKMMLMANSGKPMDIEGFFDPVILDIAGAKFDKKSTAIIADHNTQLRIGHTTEQAVIPFGGKAEINGKTIKGPMIAASGVVSSESETAKGFVADGRKKFPFQVSVGAFIQPGGAEFVPEGEKAEVNGKNWAGPLLVARKTLIRELTVAVLGADNNTSAKLAAQILERKKAMSPELKAYIEGLHLDPAKLSADAVKSLEAQLKANNATTVPAATVPAAVIPATVPAVVGAPVPVPATIPATVPVTVDPAQVSRDLAAADELRIGGIRAVASRFPDMTKVNYGGADMTPLEATAKAIKDNATADVLELAFRRSEIPEGGSGPAIHATMQDIDGDALQCSLLRYAGCVGNKTNEISGKKYGLEAMFKPEVLEASHLPQYNIGGSIQALLDIGIRAAGHTWGSTDRRSSGFVEAAVEAHKKIKASGFSTLNIVNILENVMHKTSLAAFDAVESVWPFICGRKPLNDFKAHALYRLDFSGNYRQVAADGELKHISMTDTKHSITADTFGAMVTIDRKTIRNDDLGMVIDKARGLGTLGAQRIEESVLVLLLSNPGSFFAAGNNNLITGANSELNNLTEGTGLDLARQTFRGHVINGKPIGVSPSVLLVGTLRETTAARLHKQETVQNTGNTDNTQFVNNPHTGLYRPYVSPYLNNTSITDQDGAAVTGQSATQWFLFASPAAPQGAAIVIGFLDGRDTPFFDEAETEFNVPGGMQFRSYLDWGVAMHVTQMALKSAGV